LLQIPDIKIDVRFNILDIALQNIDIFRRLAEAA